MPPADRNALAKKRRISAISLVKDVRAGYSDEQLRVKYRVTRDGLQYLLTRLVDSGLITHLELYSRQSLSESDLMRAFSEDAAPVLKCIRCGNVLPEGVGSCPHCDTLAVELQESLVIEPEVSLGPSNPLPDLTRTPGDQFIPTDPFGSPGNALEILEVKPNIRDVAQQGDGLKGQALLKAASRGIYEQVEALMNSGVNADSRSRYGNTPLIRAAFKGHPEVAKLLLDRGADVNAENVQGNTALIFAVSAGHAEVVELLLNHGANAGTKAPDGNTA